MNTNYSNGPVYPSPYTQNQRLSYQQLPAAAPTPGSNNLITTSAPSVSHTLPPISSGDYGSSLGNDMLGTRAQPLQPSLMTAEPNPMGQQAPTPIYGPTSTTFFSGSGPVGAYSQAGLTSQTYRSAPQNFSVAPQANQSYPPVPRSGRLPDLRPMPINTMSDFRATTSSNSTPPGSASRSTDDGAQPIHVVGSQGRRGILPSVAGRPVAVADDGVNGSKNAANPIKDASGKYPCEHCAKTYLHAKHLKRHMLRRKSPSRPIAHPVLIHDRYGYPTLHLRSLSRYLFPQ